jgi:cell pole-organizing protein PopZ
MSSPQHEPTMEEILASIRDIMSEGNPEAARTGATSPASAPAPPKHVVAMEVLELTQEMVVRPSESRPIPRIHEPEPEKTEEILFERVAVRHAAESNDIFSDSTRKAMEDSFESVPDEAEPAPQRPQQAPAAAGGSSVESVFERSIRESFEPVLKKYLDDNSQLVIERMKLLIREWMDENFPALLENAIRGEVERIVKARTRR